MAGEMGTNSNHGKQEPFLLDCFQAPDLFTPCQHSLKFLPEIVFHFSLFLTPFAQKQVNTGQYGPGMSELEKQIAEHNILQKEIEAYGLQIKNLHSGVRHLLSPPCSSWLHWGPCGLRLLSGHVSHLLLHTVTIPPCSAKAMGRPEFGQINPCRGWEGGSWVPGWFLNHLL